MTIEITPKKSTGVERLLAVSVPVEQVRDAEEHAARRYASKVRLPGFRPGQGTARHRAQAIRARRSASRRSKPLVRKPTRKPSAASRLKLVGQPHVHDLKFEEGKPLTFELHLEVRPDVDARPDPGFRVERPAATP